VGIVANQSMSTIAHGCVARRPSSPRSVSYLYVEGGRGTSLAGGAMATYSLDLRKRSSARAIVACRLARSQTQVHP
jgi:hypothetical protein